MKHNLLQICIVCIATLISVPQVHASTLSFIGSDTLYADTCSSFDIQLNATESVAGGTTVTSFPTAQLQVKNGDNGITAGNIFNSLVSKLTNNNAGTAKYVAYRLSNYSGTGTVNSILFNVLATGSANLSFLTGIGNTEIAINGAAIAVTLVNKTVQIINDAVKPTATGQSNTWYMPASGSATVNFSDAEAGFHQITVNNPAGFPKVRKHITDIANFTLTGFGTNHQDPYNQANARKTIINTKASGLTHSLSNAQCGADPERYFLSASVSGQYCFQPLEYVSGTLKKVQDTHGNEANDYSISGRIQDWPIQPPTVTFGNSGDPNVIPVHIDFPSIAFDFDCNGSPENISYKDIQDYLGNQTHRIPKESIVVKTQMVLPSSGSAIQAQTTAPAGGQYHAVIEYAENCDDPFTACDITIRLASPDGQNYLEQGAHNVIVSATDDYHTRQQSLRSTLEDAENRTITPTWTQANGTRTVMQSALPELTCEAGLITAPISTVLKAGETQQINAIFNSNTGGSSPEDVTNNPLTTYGSSNESIAVINTNGLVTAIGSGGSPMGSAEILTNYGAHNATSTIIVPSEEALSDNILRIFPEGPITLSLNALTPATAKLTAVLNGINVTADAEWVSSSSSTLSVSGGNVTALTAGTAGVTARYDGKTADVDFVIEGEGESPEFHGVSPLFSISPSTFQLSTGGNLQLSSQYSDQNVTSSTTFLSSANDIASVTSNGYITAKKTGEVKITGTYENNTESASGVVANGSTCGLITYPTQATVLAGDEIQLFANMNGQDVTDQAIWNSSDESVASISSRGTLITHAIGNVFISANFNNNTSISEIHVSNDGNEQFFVYPDGYALRVGQQFRLGATFNGIPTAAEWQVIEGQNMASITIDGILTATQIGTVTVSASVSGQNKNITLYILPADGQFFCTSDLSVYPQELTLNVSETAELSIESMSENVSDEATCVSSNELVASVSEDCVVTAHNSGRTIIGVTYNGRKRSIEITIPGEDILRGAACDLRGTERASSETIWINQHGESQKNSIPVNNMTPENGATYVISSWWNDIDGIPHVVINGAFNSEGKWYSISEGWYDKKGMWRNEIPNGKILASGWYDDFGIWHESRAPKKGETWKDRYGNKHIVSSVYKDQDCITHVYSAFHDAEGKLHGAPPRYLWPNPLLWILLLIIALWLGSKILRKKNQTDSKVTAFDDTEFPNDQTGQEWQTTPKKRGGKKDPWDMTNE